MRRDSEGTRKKHTLLRKTKSTPEKGGRQREKTSQTNASPLRGECGCSNASLWGKEKHGALVKGRSKARLKRKGDSDLKTRYRKKRSLTEKIAKS